MQQGIRRFAGKVLVLALTLAGAASTFSVARAQAPQGGAAQNAPAGNADSGKKLFNSVGCYQCHGYSGQGGAGARLAPNPMPFAALTKYIRAPKGQMPPYTEKVLTDAQVADIYAFLKTVPKAPDPNSIPMLNQQ